MPRSTQSYQREKEISLGPLYLRARMKQRLHLMYISQMPLKNPNSLSIFTNGDFTMRK